MAKSIISDADLANHYANFIRDGFVLNPQNFLRLAGWNDIILQLTMAKHFLKELRAHDRSLGSKEDAFEESSFFISFLAMYGKCFASAGTSRISLDAKEVFRGLPQSIKISHRRIIQLRNTYAAHNEDSGLVISTIAIKEDASSIRIVQLATTAIPADEFQSFDGAVRAAEKYVISQLNKYISKMERDTGKRIILI